MGLRPDVELHVEELVLDGVPAGDRAAVAEALRAELGRMIAERGLPPDLGRRAATLETAGPQSGAGQSAAQLGIRIARSLLKGDGR
jgi:hypothetical protein